MDSVFSHIANLSTARALFVAIVGSLGGIAALLTFIVGRRWVRGRHFRKRDATAAWVRQHWDEIVSGALPARVWAEDQLTRSVMEAVLLDRAEVADKQQLEDLVECLRRGGILDERIQQAREAGGWKQRAALVLLGRTRAPEALPALAEALDSGDMQTRIAAVRGLGKLGSATAAAELLRRIEGGAFGVPANVVKNALLSCCASDPGPLARCLEASSAGASTDPNDQRKRDMLARVLAEVADSATWNDLIVMSGDSSAEVRGSAARGLARAPAEIAILPLAQLAEDPEWFVRVRAVVALGAFVDQGATPVLLKRLTDRQRLVRQRAAWALMRSRRLVEVLQGAVQIGDNYGLQALVSELDRHGLYEELIRKLGAGSAAQVRLANRLKDARRRLLPEPFETVHKEMVTA